LLVETLQGLSATQTVTQDIAERMTQTLASVTAVSTELDATSVDKTMSICEELSLGDYGMNDATAGSLLSSVHNAIAASELLYASDDDTLGRRMRACEALLHQIGAAVASQRVPGETSFEKSHRVFSMEVQVYPRTASPSTDRGAATLPERLLDAAGNIVDSEGAYASLIEWTSITIPHQTEPEQRAMFASSVFSLHIGEHSLVGRRSSDRVVVDMPIHISSQNVSLGCGSWNTSTQVWQIEATTSSERVGVAALQCAFTNVGSYVAIHLPESTAVGGNAAQGAAGLAVADSDEVDTTFSTTAYALLLLLSAATAAILIVFSVYLRANGTAALRPQSCVARRRAESFARASSGFALCCTVNVSCSYRVAHLTAFLYEALLVFCGSLLVPPNGTGASWLDGVIVAVAEFALAELTVTPIRQMFVGGGWSATVAKISPDNYGDDEYEKPMADVTGATKVALRARWFVSLMGLLSLCAVCGAMGLVLLGSDEEETASGSVGVIVLAAALRFVIELVLLVVARLCTSSHLRSNSYEQQWSSEDGRNSDDLSSDSIRSR